MKTKYAVMIGMALLSLSVVPQAAQSATGAAAPSSKPIMIHRLYTGPDGQTHVEVIEAKFTNGGYKLAGSAGAEVRRAPPGRVADWHTAPRRQYVITLSGHGEVELNDGTKIELGPGDIDLAEDLTGKGHITRTIGNEDRVTMQIPIAAK